MLPNSARLPPILLLLLLLLLLLEAVPGHVIFHVSRNQL
jgi:hypothetical protein